MDENLTFLLCMVLLPVIPGFLFFKALPSEAIVKGPLKGFRIDLSGAFGGYFALVLLLVATQNLWRQPPIYQMWEVNGRLVDEHGNGLEPIALDSLRLTPPILTTQVGGNFRLMLATQPTPGGTMGYPDLEITFRDRSRTLHLDDRLGHEADLRVERRKIDHKILLGDIPLKKSSLPPYPQ